MQNSDGSTYSKINSFHRITLIVVASLPLVVALFASRNEAQTEKHDTRVFRITAMGIGGTSKGRILTGFRVAGVKGIVTALHGVAGVRRLDAGNRGFTFKRLEIRKVDVTRDLALISSSELDAMPADGMTIARTVPPDGAAVRIIGHPYGISQTHSDYQVRRSRIKLEELLPQSEEARGIRSRNSPDVKQSVVDLQAVIVSGLSGAPVMNANAVFSVANGSLAEGTTDFVWAIPLTQATIENLVPYTKEVREAVESLPPAEALNRLNADLPPVLPFTDSKEEQGGPFIGDKHYAKTTLTISEIGKLHSKTKIKNEDVTDGFCVWPAIFFYDELGRLIHTSRRGSAFCVGSVAEVRLNRLLGRDAQLEREESHDDTIPLDVLARTYKIAIIHERGKKDPFERLTADEAFARAVEAAAKAIPRPDL